MRHFRSELFSVDNFFSKFLDFCERVKKIENFVDSRVCVYVWFEKFKYKKERGGAIACAFFPKFFLITLFIYQSHPTTFHQPPRFQQKTKPVNWCLCALLSLLSQSSCVRKTCVYVCKRVEIKKKKNSRLQFFIYFSQYSFRTKSSRCIFYLYLYLWFHLTTQLYLPPTLAIYTHTHLYLYANQLLLFIPVEIHTRGSRQ